MSKGGTSRVRWFLVFWLFVLSTVAFLDRVNISIAGSSIASEYHLSNVRLGWVFSAFLLGYALFQTPGGRLADRFGPRRVLTAGVWWWGIFTALTAVVSAKLASALALFVSIRFLLGMGEAIMFPASNQFVARWIPTHERGVANGWIFAGVGAGAGITPPLITFVMLRYGWRSSFWLCGIIGIIAGFVWFLAARDTPQEHPSVSPSELAAIQSGLTVEGSNASKNRLPLGQEVPRLVRWRDVVLDPTVLVVTLSYFAFGYVAWIFFSWFYIYLATVRGLNLRVSAFYATLPFLAMAVCCPLGGIVSDWLTRTRGKRLGRCGIAVFSMGLTAIFLAFGSHVASAPLASVILAGGAGALYLSQSSFWSVTADIAGSSSGSVSGFMNMGAQIGGAVTASLTPAIASRLGWMASFAVAAVLSALGGAAWLLVDPERSLIASPVSSKPELSFKPQ